MKIQRIRGGNWLNYVGAKYEATQSLGNGVTQVHFIGFGDTHLEAMMKCLSKVIWFNKK